MSSLNELGIIPECDIARADERARQRAEIEALKEELETERVRLAACGVVAMANTPETASKCREMRPEYRSASCDDVAKAVDREMALRAERDALRSLLERIVVAVDAGGVGFASNSEDFWNAIDAAREKK